MINPDSVIPESEVARLAADGWRFAGRDILRLVSPSGDAWYHHAPERVFLPVPPLAAAAPLASPEDSARWRQRGRERRAADPALADRWRAQRREQKKRAKKREQEQVQWDFGANAFCLTCGGAVETGQLYCATRKCDHRIYHKHRRGTARGRK